MFYHERAFNKATVPAVVDVFCSVIGRYVIYYNKRFSELKYPHGYSEFAFVDLCEVEVYGKRCFAKYIFFLKVFKYIMKPTS